MEASLVGKTVNGWLVFRSVFVEMCSLLAGFQKQGAVTDRLACKNIVTKTSCCFYVGLKLLLVL